MYRRILIPTDFSTASEWVFDDALRIAAENHAELLILHVRMTRTSNPDELRFPADESIYEYAERQELDRLRERMRRTNATVPIRMIVRRAPNPGAEIGRVAETEDVDLIVMSTHARHHVAHLLVGSTTLSILRNPPAPVLAIRYGTRKRGALRRVVVPVHLEQTKHAALDLAVREKHEVHIITICDEDDTTRAEALQRELLVRAPGATTRVIQGDDAEKEIVRYTQSVDADAIFLNAESDPGEVKIDIIRSAPVPVMLVPTTPSAPR